jgi:hypothetical protein
MLLTRYVNGSAEVHEIIDLALREFGEEPLPGFEARRGA